MADGSLKPIEDIRVGDQVLSFDEKSDGIVTSSVAKTFVHPNNTAGYVIINGIKVTPNHQLWVNGKWTDAGEIKPGDQLHMMEGSELAVDTVEYIQGTFTVYNFEVADTHNYFTRGILGHNAAYDKFNDPGCIM